MLTCALPPKRAPALPQRAASTRPLPRSRISETETKTENDREGQRLLDLADLGLARALPYRLVWQCLAAAVSYLWSTLASTNKYLNTWVKNG